MFAFLDELYQMDIKSSRVKSLDGEKSEICQLKSDRALLRISNVMSQTSCNYLLNLAQINFVMSVDSLILMNIKRTRKIETT